ncbi:MAG TPA: sigma 54-interacting transcriptional regulator [Coriobacteriia bacterium]
MTDETTYYVESARRAELEALLDVSGALHASFDLDRNLASAMRLLADRLGLRRTSIMLIEPESDSLRIAVAHGLSAEEKARGTYRTGEGVVGRVIESGRAMIVPDVGEEPLFLNRTRARHGYGGLSFLCVPIRAGSETLGVLTADRVFAEEGALEDDLRVLQIVSAMLGQTVQRFNEYSAEKRRTEQLGAQLKERFSFPNIIGDSDRMQEVFAIVTKVAKTKVTVLLRGESGTGKELVARAVHFSSAQAKGPFVAVNCAALPETLLEGELFGSEKGAFTGAVATRKGRFELADGGTILLDEIGDLSPGLQAKLLRVLQEGTFERLGGQRTLKSDARVIAATNRDLEAMVREGTFREDLYWRLNVVPVFLPPLRERSEDLPLLIEHFLKSFAMQAGRPVRLDRDAMRLLMRYPWPGNIRELENTLQRLVVLADSDTMTPADLPMHLVMHDFGESTANMTLEQEVEALERQRITASLRRSGHVHARAARELGITARQFGYKVRKYGLE